MEKKVLFVCIHNSARSQMAEALLEKYSEGLFSTIDSAGFEPGELNPLVVQILKEDEDIDISHKSADSLFDYYTNGKRYNFVITVCDEAHSQKCPIFPGVRERIKWSFEDPSTFKGPKEEIIEKIRVIKNQIKTEVLEFIQLVKEDKLKDNFPINWKLG